MSTLWEFSDITDNEDVTNRYSQIIQDAYAEPQQDTEELQRRAITDFQNEYLSACLVGATQ